MSNLECAMVYKSNSLVEASYRLSVAEQRILLACISQVRRGETITDEIMYSVSAFTEHRETFAFPRRTVTRSARLHRKACPPR